MTVAGSILAVASLWLLGALVMELAGIRRRGAGQVAVDYAAGVVVLSVLGTTMVILGVRVSIYPVYAVLAAMIAAAVRVRRWPAVWTGLPRDPLAVALLLGTGGVLLVILAASWQDRLWWDGWAIWAFKARALFGEGTLNGLWADGDGAFAFTHPDYPLAVPLVDWWAYRHAGRPDPAIASFLGGVWFVLLPVVLWDALRDRVGERIAALAALGLALFWPIASYATGGTADVVVALAILGAVAEFGRAFGAGDAGATWRSAVFVALGAQAKNEGLAFALVAVAVSFASAVRAGRSNGAQWAALGTALALAAPWSFFAWLRRLGEPMFTLISPAELPARLALVGQGFMLLTGSGAWLPLTALVVCGALAAAHRRVACPGWAVMGGYLAVLVAVYVLTPQDLEWLLVTSLPRVVGACVPGLVLLAVHSLGERTAATAGIVTRDARSDVEVA